MLKEISLNIFYNSELLSLLFCASVLALLTYIALKKLPEKCHDVIWVTFLTLFYAVVSLWQLGATSMPAKTGWKPDKQPQSVIFKVAQPDFDTIVIIGGEGDNNAILDSGKMQIGFQNAILYGSYDLKNWQSIKTLDTHSYLQYNITQGDFDYPYLAITCIDTTTYINEIAIAKNGKRVDLSLYSDENALDDAHKLIDEQDSVVFDPTYMNETYFDEIYHVRNAQEIANQQYMYASVHPLLGTSLIALGIRLFGLTPFGFRFMGALFGILMMPLMFYFGKLLFEKRRYAILTTILFGCSFMHVTTSRIATLEPFSIFFMIAASYFIMKYVKTDFYDQKQPLNLLGSGLMLGCSIATKWTGCYLAVGIAILFFAHLWTQYRKAKETQTISQFMRHTFRLFWICVGCFIVIPAVIYWGHYLITPVWKDGYSIQNVVDQIVAMYQYHADLQATHPFQSEWWQWVLDLRPIWYFSRVTSEGVHHSISAFENPLLCWGGIVGLLYTSYATLKKKSFDFAIVLFYLSALLPWVLVDRCVFIYHYYPAIPFMILAIVYGCKALIEADEKQCRSVYLYTGAVVLLFILFLPATCGFGTKTEYLHVFLRWFESWYFG